ncbi:hypothetical protein BDR26DRAFT_931151 [Obelidium mucronatum]|nr:hypothetical protein BDR26DRAFT_931151 [Obelidium mucronatum]
MPLKKALAQGARFFANAATEQNVIISGALFFLSYSILRRTNAAFFPDEALAFAPDWTFAFGYPASKVLSLEIDSLYLIGATLANLVAIASFGFLSASIVSWAAESLGGEMGQNLVALNQIPAFNAFQHIAESIFFTAGAVTDNSDLAGLAGSLSDMRSLTAILSLVLTGVAAVQFLRIWIVSIGRDGRQKIAKKAQ